MGMAQQNALQLDSSADDSKGSSSGTWKKVVLLAIVIGVIISGYMFLDIKQLAKHEATLQHFQTDHPVLVYGAAFLVYVFYNGSLTARRDCDELDHGLVFQLLARLHPRQLRFHNGGHVSILAQ